MFSFIYRFPLLALLITGLSAASQNTTLDLDTDTLETAETPAPVDNGHANTLLPYVQGEGITKDEMSSGYNAPGRIDLKGKWDSWVTGSFIFWQALEENIYVARSDIRSTTDYPKNQIYYNMDFDYHPGFKAGIGHSLNNHDNWSFFLRYTGLHLKNKVTHNFNEYVLIPSFYAGYSGIFITSATAKWRLNFDMVDLDMERSFYLGTRLITKPFVGLKGGYIKQKYRNNITNYNANIGTYYPYYKGKVDSWKIGARAGCDFSWFISRAFRVNANLAIDLLYADFRSSFTNYLYAGTASNMYTLTATKNTYVIQPVFETALGFGWGSYFANDRLHFDVSALYEFQVYLRENQFLFEQIYDDMGALYLHGLTVNARLGF